LRARHAFAREEIQSMQAVAQLVAAALGHITDRDGLARKVQEMHGLYRAGEALAEIGEEAVLLQRAAELLVSELRYLSAWIAMVLPGGKTMRGAAGAGGARVSSPEYSLEDRSPMAVDAFHRGKPTAYVDIQARAEKEGWGDVARRMGFQCVVAVPLRAGGQTLGVLFIGSAAPSAGDDELSLVAAFGNQLAGAVVRVRQDRERAQQVATLQQAYEQQARLLDVVRALSTPVIPVHDGVLVLPLVGTIDSTRSAQIMDALLEAVQREGASVVIVDVTGVPMVDSAVANHLLQAIRAASLLGAHCVLVGIAPSVAQTIVQLGIDLSGVATRSNLQAGIAHALQRLRLEIRPIAAEK
jgi:anti-anti-sigma factor